jgi:protein-S-isoprenylcysteine O-methyltransferase Ste14
VADAARQHSIMARLAEVLARRRVALGFACGALAAWLARPTWTSMIAGVTVASVGEALRIWAAGHLEKGREVTMTGPYRFNRHPLYLGSTIMGVGLAIAAHSVIVAALVLGYLGATLAAAISREEAHLTEKFGTAYPAYRNGLARPYARRFSIRRVIANREYRAVIGFLVAFALLALRLR